MPGFLKARVDDGNGFFARNLGFDPGATTTSFPNVIPATSSPTGSASTSSASALQTNMASNQSGGETKMILEWVFAVSALFVIAALSLFRYIRLRRAQDDTLSSFLARQRPNYHGQPPRRARHRDSRLDSDLQLTTPPRRQRGTRAVQGPDVDAGGRRLGGRGDVEGEAEDKDALPAYDAIGSPPKYFELGVGAVAQRAEDVQMVSLPSMESVVVVSNDEGSEEASSSRQHAAEEVDIAEMQSDITEEERNAEIIRTSTSISNPTETESTDNPQSTDHIHSNAPFVNSPGRTDGH